MLNKLTITMALGAALVLAGCSDDAADPAGPGATGSGTTALDPASVAYFQQNVGDRVYFETDSTRLTPVGQQTLVRQAEWLAQNPGVNAVVEGHADERGTREYNLALGARRAEAARSYLASQGVAPSRLSTVSYGKERPDALCSAESCWTQNRRSVTVVTGGAGV